MIGRKYKYLSFKIIPNEVGCQASWLKLKPLYDYTEELHVRGNKINWLHSCPVNKLDAVKCQNEWQFLIKLEKFDEVLLIITL